MISDKDERKKRSKLGLCPTCPNQLYKTEMNKFNPLIKKKVYLTNRNVFEGRCLNCDPLPKSKFNEAPKFASSRSASILVNRRRSSLHEEQTKKAREAVADIGSDEEEDMNSLVEEASSSSLKVYSNVEEVIEEMFLGSTSVTKDKWLCDNLLSLAVSDEIKVNIIIGGGLIGIHNIIYGEHVSDVGLQEKTCAILKMLLPIAEDKMIEDISFVETIMCLMTHHPMSLNIQEMGINILCHLSERDDNYKRLISDNGGIGLIESIMHRFPSLNIKRDGNALIANLS